MFSTFTVHVTGLPPLKVRSGFDAVKSTPVIAPPEPSPAVVVTITSPVSGAFSGAVAVAVTVVSQLSSAFCERATVRVVVSEPPPDIWPGICSIVEVYPVQSCACVVVSETAISSSPVFVTVIV